MSYKLVETLKIQNFQRVERDDRLFDILPTSETKAKGVELWERWEKGTVHLVRLTAKGATKHSLARQDIEQALTANRPLDGQANRMKLKPESQSQLINIHHPSRPASAGF